MLAELYRYILIKKRNRTVKIPVISRDISQNKCYLVRKFH